MKISITADDKVFSAEAGGDRCDITRMLGLFQSCLLGTGFDPDDVIKIELNSEFFNQS